jgi:hypothetical protein
MACWLATESVLAAHWVTPWIWPARPPHDRGAAICAALVLIAGTAAITLLGTPDCRRRPRLSTRPIPTRLAPNQMGRHG